MTRPASPERVVIVGAGHAAGELAGSLRQSGFSGPIVMVGEEPHLPYQRPPLSKAFLSGETDLQALELKPSAAYEKIGVEVRTAVRVESIDRTANQVALGDGTRLPYDKLVLATGGRPRTLAIPGLEHAGPLSNVHYLRTLHDAKGIRAQLKSGFRLVIVGGGYIGLEVAAVARRHGLKVTVLEALPRVLARVTAPELSDFYASVHRGAGVDIRTGTAIRSAELDGSRDAVAAVTTSDGDILPTDVLIVGVGLIPNVELAEACGLQVANGILVDDMNRTADPDVLAIGDCSNQPSALYGRRVRIESVPNALGQARAAAATLCGRGQPYTAVPWFWSDQYDLKLQIVGLSQDYDTLVLRGRREDRSFIAFYLKAGRIIAGDAVNRPKEFMQAKRLVTEGACIAAERLADESASLL